MSDLIIDNKKSRWQIFIMISDLISSNNMKKSDKIEYKSRQGDRSYILLASAKQEQQLLSIGTQMLKSTWYVAMNSSGSEGIEPATRGFGDLCSTNWAKTLHNLIDHVGSSKSTNVIL